MAAVTMATNQSRKFIFIFDMPNSQRSFFLQFHQAVTINVEFTSQPTLPLTFKNTKIESGVNFLSMIHVIDIKNITLREFRD